MEVVKLVFDILAFTSIMVLVVLGLGVIASMMGIFNFAHGEFVLLGAYTVYLFSTAGLPVWLGMLVAPVVVGAIGLVLERGIVHRFYALPVAAMLGTWALGLIIREIVRGLLGGLYYNVPEPVPGSFSLFGTEVSAWRAIVIVVTVLIVAGCYAFMTRTSYGLRIRAALENPALARSCGISTTQLYAFTFAFGAALAGLAGALMVPLFQIFADLGVRFLVQGFLSVMLGGIGTFEGPVLGGALIGAMVPGFQWLREIPGLSNLVNPVFAEVLVFVVAIVIVRLRPYGFIKQGRI
ncbi:MAG: branched-chain amino acid ABC transporter permease [Sneathiellaceae bacterium]